MTAVDSSADAMATAAQVRSSDGAKLHVRRYGDQSARPVVFFHGLGMDGLVWEAQATALHRSYQGVTVDLRGHGLSDAPADESYSSSEQWADDVHAVLQGLPSPATIVAWSYAGMVAADYLRKYGPDQLAGIYLVAPLRKVGTGEAMDLLDPAFLGQVPGLLSTDLAESVDASRGFLDLVTAEPLSQREHFERLGASLRVPAEVRAAMLSREIDNDEVWADATVPLGLGYGLGDRITKPESAADLAEVAAFRQVDEHPGAGHAVFLDRAQGFAADLDRFLGTC